jgi:hypothetical protein
VDDTRARRFFLEPLSAQQRQYEALRAFFIEGLSQKDAALRFNYSPGALRVLVHQFRNACAAGTPPPFSPSLVADDRPPRRPKAYLPSRMSQRPPTPAP